MTHHSIQRSTTAVTPYTTQRPVVYSISDQGIAGLERLHPTAQIVLAIGLGLGLPFALVSIAGIMAGMVATVATFCFAILALFSQFILAIGAGVGILILVVVGVIGLIKL